MKKYISILFVLIILICLCSCGSNSSELDDMQAQLDALTQQLSNGESEKMAALREAYEALLAENEALKKEIAELKSKNPVSYSRDSITYPPSVAEAVKLAAASEEFIARQELFKEFTGSTPDKAEVKRALHYQLEDFEGEKMDCYLVEISTDTAYWSNEAANEGAIEYSYYVFVNTESGVSYNSIALDSNNYNGALSTDEDKASYLLWSFSNSPADSEYINLMNDEEIISWLSEAEIFFLNESLA